MRDPAHCSSGPNRKLIAAPLAPSPRQHRRLAETSIAFLRHRSPAAPLAHYLPTRFRALALFGRRSPERVVRSSSPAAENLHMCGHSTTNKSAYMKYNIARPASMQTTPAIIEIVLRRQASELVGAADLNLVLHEAEQLRLRRRRRSRRAELRRAHRAVEQGVELLRQAVDLCLHFPHCWCHQFGDPAPDVSVG